MIPSKVVSRAVLYASMFCTGSYAAPVVISEDVFVANGGDLLDISGTIAKAMDPLWAESLASPFLSVGKFEADGGFCTATWLGDTTNGRSVVLLTAAHCVEGMSQKGTGHFTFTDYAGAVTASGEGSYITSPYRFAQPAGFGGASTSRAAASPLTACSRLKVCLPR